MRKIRAAGFFKQKQSNQYILYELQPIDAIPGSGHCSGTGLQSKFPFKA